MEPQSGQKVDKKTSLASTHKETRQLAELAGGCRPGAMSRDRKRILMFGYLPPPVFGPSIAYQTLMRSEFSRHFDVTFVNLSLVKSIRELESFRLSKLLKLTKLFAREFWYLLTRRFDFCCYPISYKRMAFLKDVILLGLARMFGVPTVLWGHGSGFRNLPASLGPRWRRLCEKIIGQAAAVLVLAECLRSDFEGLAPPDRIHVVTIGIEPQTSLPAMTKSDKDFTILYLGMLAKAKGVFDLLQAMPRILAGFPEARLLFAGEWFRPEDEAAALQFVREQGLERAVKFIGPVYDETKWRLLRSADVFVFPPHSETEAFGIVLLEAMQAGVAIVATRGGARSEVITDGVNGLLAAEQTPPDLADKIGQLLADPLARSRMGQANRERFDCRYTHEQYGRRLITLFEAL